MKLTKQPNKTNYFNIENLNLSQVLSIISALEYLKHQGLQSNEGNRLLEALLKQDKKLIKGIKV